MTPVANSFLIELFDQVDASRDRLAAAVRRGDRDEAAVARGRLAELQEVAARNDVVIDLRDSAIA